MLEEDYIYDYRRDLGFIKAERTWRENQLIEKEFNKISRIVIKYNDKIIDKQELNKETSENDRTKAEF